MKIICLISTIISRNRPQRDEDRHHDIEQDDLPREEKPVEERLDGASLAAADAEVIENHARREDHRQQ